MQSIITKTRLKEKTELIWYNYPMKIKAEEASDTKVSGVIIEEIQAPRKIKSLDELGERMIAPRPFAEVESELKDIVATGDVEILQNSEGFQRRSVEGRVLLTADTLSNLHTKLEKALKILINGGQEDREAAMGVVTRMRSVRDQRAKMLRDLYNQHPKVLTSVVMDGEIKFDK
jgi:hypothetical protein